MCTPVKSFGSYIVTFEAQAEDITSRHHFIKHCGWTAAQFREIQNYPFFTAHVVLWRDGEEVADQYLGACCYKTEEEFFTQYAGDYFADMVMACADQTDDIELKGMVNAWRFSLRNSNEVTS